VRLSPKLVPTRQGSLIAHSRRVRDAIGQAAQPAVASMPQLHLKCWRGLRVQLICNTVFHTTFVCAQSAQIQALPRACSGTPDSSTVSKLTLVHQHGGCGTPLVCFSSKAQWLACPHRGQREGSAVGMTCKVGLRRREYRLTQSVRLWLIGQSAMIGHPSS
jgi:hypothetical protein